MAGLLTCAYYFFWLKPRVQTPNALIAAQTALYAQRQNLVASRLALLELARLQTNGALTHAHADILGNIASSYEQLQNNPPTELPYKPIQGAPTGSIQFTNQILPAAFDNLQKRHIKVAESQQPLVISLSEANDKLVNVYAYNPSLDIGNLDPEIESEQIRERAAAARDGLQNILDAISSLDLPALEKGILEQEMRMMLRSLDSLISATNQNDIDGIQSAREQFIDQFVRVQAAALTSEQALLHSPEAVNMLTDLTNTILIYDFWLGRINQELQRL